MTIKINKLAQLTGHKAAVYTLAPAANTTFLSGAGEGWIVEWDIEQPELGKLVAKVDSNIFSLLNIPQHQLLIVGNMNGGVHWVDLADPSATKNIAHHKKGVFDILQVEDYIFTIGGGGMITKWSCTERRSLESFQLTNQSLRSIDYNPIRKEFAIGSSDHTIYFIDSDSLTIKSSIKKAHDNSVFTVKYSPDGQHLISGGRDAHLKQWDIHNNNELLSSQPAHMFTINNIAFHPKGQLMATASRDKTIKIWNTSDCKLLKVIDTVRDGGHVNSVNKLLWLEHQNILISCSDDRSIILWQLEME